MKNLYIFLLIGLFSISYVKAETEVKVKKIEVSISSEDLNKCKDDALSEKALNSYACYLKKGNDYIILGSDGNQVFSFKYKYFTEDGKALPLEDKWIDAKVNIKQGQLNIVLFANGNQWDVETLLQKKSKENAFNQLTKELAGYTYNLVVVNK